MAGFEVGRSLLDQKAAETILAVREAFDDVETLSAFLARIPSDAPEGDRLTMPQVPVGGEEPVPPGFGYTSDEAYLLRVTFEALRAARQSLAGTLDTARQLTGLS